MKNFKASGYIPLSLFRKAEEKKGHLTSQLIIRPEYLSTLRSLEYKCERNFKQIILWAHRDIMQLSMRGKWTAPKCSGTFSAFDKTGRILTL